MRHPRRLAVLLWALLGCAEERPLPPLPELPEAHLRANAALDGMLTGFWSGTQDYFERELPFYGLPTAYWHYAHAYEAVLDGVERSHGLRYAGWPARLFDAQAGRSWTAGLYDDQNWMALALLRAYDLGLGERALTQARALGDTVFGAWDTTCCGPVPGGIWWDQAHTQKATASNAGPVITAVRLHERTGEPGYLDTARRVYGHWRAQMVLPDTGQVLDHLTPEGQKVDWKFSYNEGQMLGAALELHRSTGEAAYLHDAHLFGQRLAVAFTEPTALGPVLSDGPSCGGDCLLFKGIAYRYLHQLQGVDPRPEYEDVLRASAQSVWTNARDEATGLFGANWVGGQPSGSTLAQHAAATMALNLAAQGERGEVREAPAWRYEAEEAWLQGFAVRQRDEASRASGFGYVSNLDREDEALRVEVAVPHARRYTLTLRYRAPRSAQRTLASPSHAEAVVFPETTDGAFAELALDWELEAGVTPLELSRGEGARGRLELDALELREAGTCGDEEGGAPEEPRWTDLSPGEVLCEPLPRVCWSKGPGVEEHELVVDGVSVCRTEGGCCRLPPLAPGWHRAYVVARSRCGARAGRALAFGWAPPLRAPAPEPTGHGVRWEPVEGAESYDVLAGEARVCAGVRRTACSWAPDAQPEGELRVVARPKVAGACARR